MNNGQPTVNFFLIAVVSTLAAACSDYQTETYDARFTPSDCLKACTVTPFFSPDTSIATYTSLIESATQSIDIYTPGLSSWSQCTSYTDDCIGCTIEQQKQEAFPVFPALLNAVHRGVAVRIITNNCSSPTCAGKIAPLDWFVLNKIQVRFYTSTSFQHAKFIVVDKGAKTALSSVNWSYTSFMLNREAGVILEDCTCSAIDFYQSVYEYDWNEGMDYVVQQNYSPEDMKIITNPAAMPYTIPDSNGVPGAYVTQLISYSNVPIRKAYTSPDNARETIMSYFPTVKHSFQLAVYQLTDSGLCDEILDLFHNGINVTVLVTDYIVSYSDYLLAQDCYKKLYDGGMTGKVQYAYSKFSFSHEKYWIIDNTEVHLSTGNWSPTDFPDGSSWRPYSETHQSVNRDLEIVMEDSRIAAYFLKVYNADWASGKEFKPKSHLPRVGQDNIL